MIRSDLTLFLWTYTTRELITHGNNQIWHYYVFPPNRKLLLLLLLFLLFLTWLWKFGFIVSYFRPVLIPMLRSPRTIKRERPSPTEGPEVGWRDRRLPSWPFHTYQVSFEGIDRNLGCPSHSPPTQSEVKVSVKVGTLDVSCEAHIELLKSR